MTPFSMTHDSKRVKGGAMAICLGGGYKDNLDNGTEFWYTVRLVAEAGDCSIGMASIGRAEATAKRSV